MTGETEAGIRETAGRRTDEKSGLQKRIERQKRTDDQKEPKKRRKEEERRGRSGWNFIIK